MLNVQEVAKRYKVSRDTVLSWIASGTLGAVNVAPSGARYRRFRINEDAIKRFEQERSTKPATVEPMPKNLREYV